MGIKGAYRLTFLMSKIIWNDFSLIQRYENELVRRQAKVQTFELMELPVERLDAFLDQGPTGSLLERFNNENHCEVTLKKVTKKDGTAVVSATIKKVVDTVADLGETIRQLRRLATATREQVCTILEYQYMCSEFYL